MATHARLPGNSVPANDEAESLAIDHSEALGADVVGNILLIRVDKIDVGDRLRPIDPTWASALGLIMLKEGQQTPIEVCRLPGANRWTLVAGGHRHAGAEMEGIEYLRAVVVSANRDDRRMREVSENLWRRDLDPIDRAAFIAEAVAIHKRRAGIDPTVDGRAASVAVRWQKALSNEASDTNDTMSVVYGWSDEVGAQLGLSSRTIERDLLIYRRIAPSIIARLRDARHPVATNATQLRALAKLAADKQLSVVARLLAGSVKSVGEAVKVMEGRRAADDPSAKRLSAFIGAFQRMSLTEKKGALEHLLPMLPAGTMLTNLEQSRSRFSPEHERYREETLATMDALRELMDDLVEDEVVTDERGAELERLGGELGIARMTVAGNGFELGGLE